MTLRQLSLLIGLCTVVSCASSGSSDRQYPPGDPRRGVIADSMRRNTVIENARPDAPARAGVIVVANQGAASASVLDAATMRIIVTLPVGVGPHEVVVSPDGRWAVVTNYGDRTTVGNTLSVIDLEPATPLVARTIDLGEYRRPHGAVFVDDGRTLAVTSEQSQRLVLVNFLSGRVDTTLATNGRGSHMVAVRRDGLKAWTANIGDSSVTEFDLGSRRTVRTYHVAPNDEGIATTPGGLRLWVGSNTAKTVTIIDTERGVAVDTLRGFGFPYRIGISRTGRIAVVNDPTANRISLFDAVTNRELAQLDLATEKGVKPVSGGQPGQSGAGPEGVTFDPIADYAYVTLNGSNQVVAVDLAARKIVGFGDTGASPDGIAFSPIIPR